MTKRRAIVRCDAGFVKKRLRLPGRMIGIRHDPWDLGVIEIKVEGDDLPMVEEGEPIPEIGLETINVPTGQSIPEIVEHAFWTEHEGTTKHRIIS